MPAAGRARMMGERLEALTKRGAAMLDTIEEPAGAAERVVVAGGGVRGEPARPAFGAFERPLVEEAT
jgi:hypothetical protein